MFLAQFGLSGLAQVENIVNTAQSGCTFAELKQVKQHFIAPGLKLFREPAGVLLDILCIACKEPGHNVVPKKCLRDQAEVPQECGAY